jgi:CRP-like cAMP-binding protein
VRELDGKRFTLLAEFEPGEQDAIAEVLEELTLDAGTVLFEEGEPAEGLLFLAEGCVRVDSSRDPEVVELAPGASLGAFSLVASGAREARAETTSRARVLVLRRSAFRRFRETDPRAACRLLEAILAETARHSREALELPAQVGAPVASDVDPVHADE